MGTAMCKCADDFEEDEAFAATEKEIQTREGQGGTFVEEGENFDGFVETAMDSGNVIPRAHREKPPEQSYKQLRDRFESKPQLQTLNEAEKMTPDRKAKTKKNAIKRQETKINSHHNPDSKWKPYKHDRVDSGREFLQDRIAKAKPITKRVSHKIGPRDVDTTDFTPAVYEWAEYDDPLKERIISKDSGNRVERAKGPADYGINEDYEVPEYDMSDDDDGSIFKDRYRAAGSTNGKIKKKLGPTQIGRATDYEAPKYDISDDDDGTIFKDRYREAGSTTGKVKKKLGPTQIGRAEDYEAPEYDIEEDRSTEIFADRIAKPKSTHDRVQRKLGPKEIGRAKDYEAPDYDIAESPGGDNIFRDRIPRKKLDGKAERKLGPTEIGREKDYDVASFEYQDSKDFLAEKVKHTELDGRASRKLGPVEIGRATDFQPAEYELHDEVPGWVYENNEINDDNSGEELLPPAPEPDLKGLGDNMRRKERGNMVKKEFTSLYSDETLQSQREEMTAEYNRLKSGATMKDSDAVAM